MIYEPDDILDPVRAAVVLNCGPGHVRDLCERGEIPHSMNGRGQQRRHYRIRYQALRDYQQQQEQASVQQRHEVSVAFLASARRGVLALPAESAYLNAQRTVGRGRGRQLS
jgi:excisionase family DNA binding protein